MRVLVANAGSSSVKLRVLDPDDRVVSSVDLPTSEGRVDEKAVAEAVSGFGPVEAVGHRIVHGGSDFKGPVRIDEKVERRLHALADLAPMHQPAALALLASISRAIPTATAIACFDTAFHATMPAAAFTYALPAEWRAKWNLRRFGFHGLSHAYASRRVQELMAGAAPGLRVVTCHLGAGASLAAVQGGRSVDTTMGFTPLDGLVMATRSGSVDPGLVLWLQERSGTPPQELAHTLEHRSGLLGLAATSDMRDIVSRAGAGDAIAILALDVYVHRLRAGVAAMAAAMGGLDALAFTGGVGENAAAVRERAAAGLRFLGVRLHEEKNRAIQGEGDIGHSDSQARVFVIRAREDLEIVRQVRHAVTECRS